MDLGGRRHSGGDCARPSRLQSVVGYGVARGRRSDFVTGARCTAGAIQPLAPADGDAASSRTTADRREAARGDDQHTSDTAAATGAAGGRTAPADIAGNRDSTIAATGSCTRIRHGHHTTAVSESGITGIAADD